MSTTIPTTLAEYQKYVREEALKVQLDMNWPDHKLNETLRALGLPEKRTFDVPVMVTGEMLVMVPVNDAMTEEEAREKVAALAGDALRTKLGSSAGASTGNFAVKTSAIVDELPPVEVGAPDTTLSNQSVVMAANRRAEASGESYARTCENEHRADGLWHYCTRERGHEGDHAQGDGRLITSTWPQAA